MSRERPDGGAAARRIREEIQSQGLSAYEIAQRAGVHPSVVQRFVSGIRDDLYLSTAFLLWTALGMRLVTGPRFKPRKAIQAAIPAAEVLESLP